MIKRYKNGKGGENGSKRYFFCVQISMHPDNTRVRRVGIKIAMVS